MALFFNKFRVLNLFRKLATDLPQSRGALRIASLHSSSIIKNSNLASSRRLLQPSGTFQTFSRQTASTAGKLYIEFTCKKCNHRNSNFISKIAYNTGVVIIECKGCKNNHLIADNLNWFTDLNGKRNIEEILAEKGETVKKFSTGGICEVSYEEKVVLLNEK